ncbi:uncharacterized protein FTOL_04897 [Fusarium torulosum]|uniref:Uncharacterized protein n=1 Tax=Fusarium torulosum TaxID=33205 RepID=A0AAE8SGU6_9HYPO|nr:uncharacterized protein FTOL_04897 [Fusarium torulosum]
MSETYLEGLVDGQAPDGQSRLREADDAELWSTKTDMKRDGSGSLRKETEATTGKSCEA